MTGKFVFAGNLVTSDVSMKLKCFRGYIEVVDGLITKIGNIEEFQKQIDNFSDSKVVTLGENEFLMPGFVDCHTHAPQYPNIGLGLDLPLLEWLNKYTFPLERHYSDAEFAANVYDIVVRRLINNGTTTACYFGSLHLEGTMKLVKYVVEHKQRALVGKVSMNVENDAGYYNKTEKELQEVEQFIKRVLSYKNDLVQPIITPRFAVSCSNELMCALSQLASKYKCGIQSHISENKKEIEYVLETNPECASYSDVYQRCGIFNGPCIMAHAVHLTEDEISEFSIRQVSVAHCPASNTRLNSGLCPVRKLLDRGIRVGLGTDISGGDSASMLDAMRRAMDVSLHLAMMGQPHTTLDWKEAFYLATLGGARALRLEDKIGSFDVGKQFDALLIDVYAKGGPIDKYAYNSGEHALVELVQRFVYLGDDRNIRQVYVNGETIKDFVI